MKQNWEVKKLDDIIDSNVIGLTKNSSEQDVHHKFKYVKMNNITKDNRFDLSKYTCVNANKEELEKYSLSDNDFLFNTRNSYELVGKTCLFKSNSDEVILYNNNIMRIRFIKSINPCFVNYSFCSDEIINKLDKFKSGTTNVSAIYYKDLKNLEIPIPPLQEQQRIVAILDEAFSAIDKAKANTELNLKNARELFESYLSTVDAPKVSLGILVDIKTGKLNSNAAVENGQYPFFTCSREIFAIDNYAFDLEAILLAGNNASGDFNVKHYKGKFNAYQRTYVITVNKEQRILYRYLYFQLLKSLKEFKSMSVGANTRFLKLGMIQGLQIALPSLKDQQSIVSKLDALREQTKKLEAVYERKLKDLEELKKSVLQKAFSGELN
jgi:type I restriction enzyme S subunit